MNRFIGSVLLSLLFAAATTMALSSKSQGASNKVAVLGGTGRLGRQTVRQLCDRGVNVRCLVRPKSKNVPPEWSGNPKIEIVRGELLSSGGVVPPGAAPKPTPELVECLSGCTKCIAVYGATRVTKITDFLPGNRKTVEDTDPTHAKQVNYRSIQVGFVDCVGCD